MPFSCVGETVGMPGGMYLPLGGVGVESVLQGSMAAAAKENRRETFFASCVAR